MTAKMPLEYKQLPVYIETVDEDQGIVTAVPAVMGNVDHQGDRIWQGAFTKTIQERGAKVRILDNHNAASTLDVVGRIVSLREIEKAELPPELLMQYPEAIGGLSADVQFLMDTPEGAGVFKRLKAGAITEWSIGYDAVDKDHERIEVDGEEMVVRNLKQIRLWELSPVIWGANPATMTVSAKAADSTNAETGPSEGKPWRVEQREGEFCVFKLDDDGNLDGEALKCYEDEADAIAYLRALYVNVEDAGEDEGGQAEKRAVAYVADVQANEAAAAYYKELLDAHPELKEGRVLSARNATRMLSAMAAMLETLEDAGLDLPGWVKLEGEEEEKLRTLAEEFWRIKSSAPDDAGRADDSQHDEKAGPGACPPTNSDMMAQLEMLKLEISLLEVT